MTTQLTYTGTCSDLRKLIMGIEARKIILKARPDSKAPQIRETILRLDGIQCGLEFALMGQLNGKSN
jgi:hypothetical protein